MVRSHVISRRELLRAGAGLALGFGLARLPGSAAALGLAPTKDLAPEAWTGLARALQGPLLMPGDSEFRQRARPWNLRFASVLPAAIAVCASPDDVRTSVLWARERSLPFVARSGGHSYAGYSTTTGLLIDLSTMHDVAYDPSDGRATLGAGARNADVYAALRRVGRAITHGRCEAVGVAGLVLGGGVGFDMRRHGLTCDQLVATKVITADGSLVRCGEDEHGSLFWACRGGGGGNFGINVEFTFQTFPADAVTAFQITWQDELDQVLPQALDLLPSTPDRLGCKLSVVNDGESLSLMLQGQLLGDPSELRSLLDPLYRLAPPGQETISQMPYWDAQDLLSELGTPGYSHERSRYVYDALDPAAAATILDWLRRWPRTQASTNWKLFLTGGAVAEVPPDATAFVHRRATMVTSIELDWTPDDSVGVVDQNQAWLSDFHEAMGQYCSDEAYQNFIDEAENDYLHAYYGANLARLVEVKRRYDPDNVFCFPQSVPLSLGAVTAAGPRSDRAAYTSSSR